MNARAVPTEPALLLRVPRRRESSRGHTLGRVIAVLGVERALCHPNHRRAIFRHDIRVRVPSTYMDGVERQYKWPLDSARTWRRSLHHA